MIACLKLLRVRVVLYQYNVVVYCMQLGSPKKQEEKKNRVKIGLFRTFCLQRLPCGAKIRIVLKRQKANVFSFPKLCTDMLVASRVVWPLYSSFFGRL